MSKPSTSSTSSCPGDPPRRTEVNLTDQYAHPEMDATSDNPAVTSERAAASEHGSNDEIQPSFGKAGSYEFEAELTPHGSPAEAENQPEDKTEPSVEEATTFNSNDDATVAASRPLSDSEVAEIEEQLRSLLQVHGPSDLGELLNSLRPSQAEDVLRRFGTLTAFVEQLPGFILIHEDLHTFVYYQEPDVEGYDCSGSSNLQDDAYAGGSSSASDNGGHQHTASGDWELQRARSSSPSSSCYESAVEEQLEEESDGVTNAACQAPPSPCCHSRGIEVVPETSDAQTQTDQSDISRLVELQSTPQSGGVDVTQMKGRLENLRQNQVGDVQHLKTEQIIESPQAATPQYELKLKNRKATKEQKAVEKNTTGDEASQPQLRLPLRERNLPPPCRTENKLSPIEPTPSSLKQSDEQFSRTATRLPQFHKVPDCTKPASPSKEAEHQRSSEGKTAKSNTEQQLSEIARMAKKRQPELSEHEIRVKIDLLRRSRGSLSGMTFRAIVDLLLAKPKEETEDKD